MADVLTKELILLIIFFIKIGLILLTVGVVLFILYSLYIMIEEMR